MITNDEELIWEQYLDVDDQDKPHDKEPTSCGCLMVFFDEESANQIKTWTDENIPPEILSEDGVEDEPHITCQYGFHPDVSIEEITEFVNNNIKGPIKAELGEISRFSNDEYDVIKVDVISDDLQKLSHLIRKEFEGRLRVDYPNYHPHVTLAYVQKESLPHVDGETMFNGKNYVFDEFVYSTAGMEDKYDIKKCV